jgi:hypothetical protein
VADISFGFLQSEAVRSSRGRRHVLILILYVDDMAYGGTPALVKRFKEEIQREFVITYELELTWLLRIKVNKPDHNSRSSSLTMSFAAT